MLLVLRHQMSTLRKLDKKSLPLLIVLMVLLGNLVYTLPKWVSFSPAGDSCADADNLEPKHAEGHTLNKFARRHLSAYAIWQHLLANSKTYMLLHKKTIAFAMELEDLN